MDHNFNFLYKQLTGTSVIEVLEKHPVINEVDFMTQITDDNHIVLLRALLLELEENSSQSKTPSCAYLFEKFQCDFNNLVIDFHKRLDEFKKLWSDRFDSKSMLPILIKFDWVISRDDKFYLVGTGNQDESFNFYKFTVKDTVAEGVRIMALFDGALSRLQEKIAGSWHEKITGNDSKLVPLF